MEQEQDQEQTQAALYVAVDDGNKIVAMERSRRGDEGFRALLDEFTDYAANRGEIPSVLFFDIRTTDAALLPRIEAAEHSYLLDPSTATEKLDIRHAVTLKDLLYCCKYGLDPLAEGNCSNMLSTKADYRQFRNEGLPPVAREDLRRCRAVETERGTVLFTQEPDGREACERYMQHHADCFFDPDLGVETLRVYEVEVDPDGFWDKVNPQVLPTAGGMMWVPEHPFVDAEVLRRGYCLKEYDMRAGAAKLAAAPDSGTEASSEALRRLLTVVTLRHIARNGYEPFCWGGSDFPGYDFPFADRFRNADRGPAAAMTDDSRTTAADILRTCFGIDPAREEPPCPLPSGDIRFYRDFLSIDLLFRPERLLERYERDRDRREMPCHILKH